MTLSRGIFLFIIACAHSYEYIQYASIHALATSLHQISRMKIDKNYQSELIVSTDLHAGGIFFCVIYVNCLSFQENGEVVLTKKVKNALRPMDPNDVKQIENYKSIGVYHRDQNGYWICDFPEIFISLTGVPTTDKADVIVFHAFDKRLNKQWGELYTVEASH